jgi:hypothetical protein
MRHGGIYFEAGDAGAGAATGAGIAGGAFDFGILVPGMYSAPVWPQPASRLMHAAPTRAAKKAAKRDKPGWDFTIRISV